MYKGPTQGAPAAFTSLELYIDPLPSSRPGSGSKVKTDPVSDPGDGRIFGVQD